VVQHVQAGDSITVGQQLATLVSWLQQPEARQRAHHELRHLGLPPVLADDLLAAAAYELARVAADRDRPFAGDDPLVPACRALTTAARSLLRARRTAPERVPAPPDLGPVGPSSLPAIELDQLLANRVVTDHRRHNVARLTAHRPHDRAAGLTALTLATEPEVGIDPDLPPPPSDDPLDGLAWIGLWYAGRTHDPTSGRRREELARSSRTADALDRVRGLLAEALDVDEPDDAPAVVDRGAGPAPASPPADPPAPVHRTAAHG
jgi:hypothetical protein